MPNSQNTPQPRSPDPAWDQEFEQLIRQLPPPHRSAFLTHLRHHPPPHRLFLQVDQAGSLRCLHIDPGENRDCTQPRSRI